MNKDSALSSGPVDDNDNEYDNDDFEKDDLVQIAEPKKKSQHSRVQKGS